MLRGFVLQLQIVFRQTHTMFALVSHQAAYIGSIRMSSQIQQVAVADTKDI